MKYANRAQYHIKMGGESR